MVAATISRAKPGPVGKPAADRSPWSSTPHRYAARDTGGPARAGRTAGAGPGPAWDFSGIPVTAARPGVVQAKLVVGRTDDPLEREADLAADAVMGGAGPIPSTAAAPPRVDRKCAACETEEARRLRRMPAGAGARPAGEAPAIVHEALRGGGHPLDAATRSFFERGFSHDFDRVRVHTGASASESAAAMGARAYTVGSDIVFQQGEYAPGTATGRHLLAHELAHVVQQGGATDTLRRRECSTARVCSPPERCAKPDPGQEGTDTASSWWTLTVNIDVEADDFRSAISRQKLGHTNVRFAESNGRQFSFGFYPADKVPNESTRAVDGCVNHPDTAHDACVDRTVTYPLNRATYDAALSFAQEACRKRRYYGINAAGVSYTCTSFAGEVAKAAGQTLPKMESEPMRVYYQPVPAVDNPNTLNENLESSNQGIGSDPEAILIHIEMGGPQLLGRYPWQEKARWIGILLDRFWITERDVAAVEQVCAVGMTAGERSKVKAAVDAYVRGMYSSQQRTRVENALKS